MYKSTYLILLFFCTFSLPAQTVRTSISGKISSEDPDTKDIHIINITSNQATITSKEGEFSIPVKLNDTLVIRGVQFESQKVIISKNHITNKSIKVTLVVKTNQLKEINLKKRENMAMALNLPNAGKKPLKGVDRKIAYYKHFSIENIYYILSRNRKKDRKLKKFIEEDKLQEHNEKVFKKIRNHFKDDFFIYTLKISGKNIDTFIEYCQIKEIIKLFEKERYLEVMDVFVKESEPFIKKMKNEK